MIASLISGAWNTLLFALRNPQLVLATWAAAWFWLLYTTFNVQGIVGTIQFASTGLLNLGSMIGLPIPLVMTAILMAKHIMNFITRAILRVFRLVQQESLKVAKKAGAAVAKAVKSVKGLKRLRAEVDAGFLGSADAADQERLLLEELAEALGDASLLLYSSD